MDYIITYYAESPNGIFKSHEKLAIHTLFWNSFVNKKYYQTIKAVYAYFDLILRRRGTWKFEHEKQILMHHYY